MLPWLETRDDCLAYLDSSEGYIEFARKQIQNPRVVFRLGDSQALPVESAAYDGSFWIGAQFFPSTK